MASFHAEDKGRDSQASGAASAEPGGTP